MADLSALGRVIALIGLGLLLLGGLLWLLGRIPGVGRLPGDIQVQWGSVSCYFPIVTMILVSAVLTIVLNVVVWLSRR